ncbi:MAG: hypothetical protein IJR48_08340 [Oscillibacter sp.]|nr:hypothetical protein [Oscillibacter sp.]MBQ9618358.1 hypothetical protein [Oscillibacter sp.]
MSDREQALNIIRAMPEYKITALLTFLRAFDAETLAAMDETDEMIRTGGGRHSEDFFATGTHSDLFRP